MAERKPLQEYLTFRFLDEVLLLSKEEYQKKVFGSVPNRIGPLVEYTLFDEASSQSYLRKSNTFEAQMLSRVLRTTSLPSSSFTSLNPLTIEFVRTPQTEAEFEDAAWIAFRKRLEAAIKKAGLPERFANQLAGTFGEMVSNLFEHSERRETGIVGYKWRQGEFEYVVADNGIGLLKSLKTHPDYAHLVDAGQALETALTEGESRHGRQAKRGKGSGFSDT
jgi:hypothetical protein